MEFLLLLGLLAHFAFVSRLSFGGEGMCGVAGPLRRTTLFFLEALGPDGGVLEPMKGFAFSCRDPGSEGLCNGVGTLLDIGFLNPKALGVFLVLDADLLKLLGRGVEFDLRSLTLGGRLTLTFEVDLGREAALLVTVPDM